MLVDTEWKAQFPEARQFSFALSNNLYKVIKKRKLFLLRRKREKSLIFS